MNKRVWFRQCSISSNVTDNVTRLTYSTEKIKTFFYKARAAQGRTKRQLSEGTKDKLQSWLNQHKEDPYPTPRQIMQLMDETSTSEGVAMFANCEGK